MADEKVNEGVDLDDEVLEDVSGGLEDANNNNNNNNKETFGTGAGTLV